MLTLQGVRRLSRFDQVGFLFFDASRRGFWRSFGASVVCLPIWALAIYEQIKYSELGGHTVPPFLVIQVSAYAISWLAYPLLVLQIADWFGVWPNYYRYMVAHNWFQPVLQLMWLPLLLLEFAPKFFPDLEIGTPVLTLWILLQIAQGAYGWFMARFGLGLTPWNALALSLIDILLGELIDVITLHL